MDRGWFRTRRGVAVVAAAALLIGLAVVWLGWLPYLVRSRVQARLERLGLSFGVESVDVDWGSLELEGVSVGPKTGATATAWFRASKLEVEWALGQLVPSASDVTALRVSGAQLQIDVDSPAFRQVLANARSARSSSGAARSGTRARPSELSIDIDSLEVRDADGTLITAKQARISVAGGRFELTSQRGQLGAAPADAILANGVKLLGDLVERRPVLASARVDDATLEWAAESVGRERRTTFSRLSALRGLLASHTAPTTAATSAAQRPRLWRDDARIELRRARVLTHEGATTQEMLTELAAVLAAQGPDALKAKGEGKQPDGGSLSWDLTVWPSERRMEGSVKLGAVSLALFAPALPPLPFHELAETRVSAQLDLVGHGLESIAVKGQAAIADLSFSSAGLAKTPVGPISLELGGQGTWTPARRELQIAEGSARVGQARASIAGTLAWPADGYRVDVTAALAKQRCAEVFASVPAGLLDEVSATELDGDFGAKVLVHLDAADLDATKVDFDIDDHCKFVALPPLLDLMRFQQPFIHKVLEPDGSEFEMETGPGTPVWTPIELVSPFMIQAVVAHEDGRFFNHHGFAEPEIAVALARNLKAHAFRFGASTITMQLVKNVFLHRDKLLSRKVQEAFITWWLEQSWDKRHILELYLNVIEYGPALYGIRNAAWHYFGTIPMNLTPAQAAFLACILPNPKAFHDQYDKKQLSPSMKNRMASFLKHMHSRQRIDDEALAFGLEELSHFGFYDPSQPPPVPPVVRGSAQAPPFDLADMTIDRWDELDIPLDAPEDGSFGAP